HPAAALYPHGRGVGHGPTALRRAAGGDGLGSDGAPHAGPAGEVSRPYGPASASEGEDRLERKEAMTSVRHHPTAALAAIICLGMPGAVAAQGQAPLEVTLAEAIRRSLDVQPAMVQARGAARNAGAGEPGHRPGRPRPADRRGPAGPCPARHDVSTTPRYDRAAPRGAPSGATRERSRGTGARGGRPGVECSLAVLAIVDRVLQQQPDGHGLPQL